MITKTSDTVIDNYISGFTPEIQKKLHQFRSIVLKIAPKATESLGYGIPTFKLDGNLVHFAAYKNHIGFYPAPSAIKAFSAELKQYEQSKGAIRFPLDKPLPVGLISKIVKFRLKENKEKGRSKKAKKTIKTSHEGIFSGLSRPAQGALANKGIKTAKQLSRFSEKEILALHGMGPASLPALRKILDANRLSFKDQSKP
jgi:uncharacterized protein YdhG (YjbR/CyaY superfamily)